MENPHVSPQDIRHFIYTTFASNSRPPTSREIADHFNVATNCIDQGLARLAETHDIALAPGSFSIWMAHPFSGLPTNCVAKVDGKRYWGN